MTDITNRRQAKNTETLRRILQRQQRHVKPEIQYGEGSVILYDAAQIDHASASLFDPEYWRSMAQVSTPSGGRGDAWIIRHSTKTLRSAVDGQNDGQDWVLRHYRRGGLVAKLIHDQYLWTGWRRSRPFREWQITAKLYELGFPVPHPIAAAGWRSGLFYRADLLTARVPGVPVSTLIPSQELTESQMAAIGQVVRQLHDVGLCHADLNAHNILITENEQVSVIDFDQASVRPDGAWKQNNLQRLRRSFDKLTGLCQGEPGLADSDWAALMSAYQSA